MVEINYGMVALVFAAFFISQAQVVWVELRSVFDPILYLILSISFALTLSIVLVDNNALVARVFSYVIVFWIGFYLVMRGSRARNKRGFSCCTFAPEASFSVLAVLTVVFYLSMNCFAWAISGIPLLTDDPTLNKVEAFSGGLGMVRRFNWGAGVFASLISLYWVLYSRRLMAFICLFVVIVISVLGGGKSSLLALLMGLGLYMYRPFFDFRGADLRKHIRRLTLPILFAGIFPVFVVLFIQHGDTQNVIINLVTRLLYFGDSLLYWERSDLRSYFMGITSVVDYPGHLFNSIFGLLRLTEYEIPIGVKFVQYSLGTDEELAGMLGPNTPFYVKGELFFGPFFASIYVLIMGMVFGWLRLQFARQKNGTLGSYTSRASLCVLAMSLPTEDSLFVARVFDFFVFVGLLLIVARVAHLSFYPFLAGKADLANKY